MSFGQGGPGRGPGGPTGPQGPPSTPDWAALAERSERRRARRRRLLVIGGGALATAVVAAIVATAVVSESGSDSETSDRPSAASSSAVETAPPDPEQPEPTFSSAPPPPPPPDPREILSDPKRDTAPLDAATLFPGDSMTTGGREYAKGATHSTGNCAAGTQGALGAVLTNNGCRELIRVTYRRGGVAATVGVAVFDSARAAAGAKEQAEPNIASLPGAGVPTFCRGVTCHTSANALGRYAYFTISGHTSGKDVTSADTAARQAGRDAADHAFARIVQRGRDQAAASVAGD
ncbi:hypothetical protein F0L17_16000 [Streptomyces sp. TRM43335]|uniref:Uncharacterized protein n=1 Tax=Streptomyces taklimakanensis TaxID=2569853 RepID=A0A6G2BFA1_9ACTN|nr:hypothetical protein [Streptomyces taklimakanensis]MTE20582.1 hypothetical protein [Streptomyces taklimakanensis]